MTDYKSKIKDIRNIIPIPISEALSLLKKHDGDVEKSIAAAKEANLKLIVKETGCSDKEAAKVYEAEKYDLIRTISTIRENIYDRNYQPIDGITRKTMSTVLDWMNTIEKYDYLTALSYKELATVIASLKHLSERNAELLSTLQEAKRTRDILLADEDKMTAQEFVKQNTILDVHPASQKGVRAYNDRRTLLREEVLRHLRNLK